MSAVAARYPWLAVEPYVADFTGARALSCAFELGLVDLLAAGAASMGAVHERLACDERGAMLLLTMLRAHGVVEWETDRVRLTPHFSAVLAFRDLLEARLHFAHLVAPDFLHLSTALFTDPQAFFRQARLFQLFSYERCFERTRENLEATARWMRLTSALTRYEAQACLDAFDFSGVRRQLDVGGNSGEFLIQLCQRHAHLAGTVLDLPLVCEIGRAHVADMGQGARIAFAEARGRDEPLPPGHDLISFKSMLHDWPDGDMRAFLARAHAALPSGGRVLIFERSWPHNLQHPLSYGQLPLLMFFRSYRTPDHYCTALEETGFRAIETVTIELDMPFVLIAATR